MSVNYAIILSICMDKFIPPKKKRLLYMDDIEQMDSRGPGNNEKVGNLLGI